MVHFGKEVTDMLIRFENYVSLLMSREGGKKAKEDFIPLLQLATPTNPLIFDFEGVTSISSSFADEFFGKLIKDMGFENFKSITTFRNLTPFVSNVIKNSIYHRNTEAFVKS